MRSDFNFKEYLKPIQPSIYIVLIKIFIVGIFLPYQLSNIAFLLLFLFWIISGDIRNFFHQLSQKKLLILFMGFYGLHIIGLLYSDNLFSAFKELERKFPLLLMPVIIGSMKHDMTEAKRKEIFSFYCKVTATVCLLLVFYALYRYVVTYNYEVFYFQEFTNLIRVNPIYLAMYVLFAFGIYFYEFNAGKAWRNRIAKGLVYLLTAIILMFISSKTALTVFILFSIHIIFRELKIFSRTFRTAVAITAVLLVVGIINYFPVTRERIQNVFESDWVAVWEEDYTKNATTFTGFTLRVSLWRVALHQLSEDRSLLHGVGTGDYLDYLNKAYEKPGLIAAGYTNLNLHNAFMDVILEFGIAGLLFYLFIWTSIGICAVRHKERALMILLIIFLFFSMTESILYVNKGVVFFSFWISFLLNYLYVNKNVTPGSFKTT